MLSPLMFGHNVSSVHHCHTRLTQLFREYICIKLSHHRAVIWCHTAPWPVIWDPGVSQALPHYHALACSGKRHKEIGSQQGHGNARQVHYHTYRRNAPEYLYSEVKLDLTKAAILYSISNNDNTQEVCDHLNISYQTQERKLVKKKISFFSLARLDVNLS